MKQKLILLFSIFCLTGAINTYANTSTSTGMLEEIQIMAENATPSVRAVRMPYVLVEKSATTIEISISGDMGYIGVAMVSSKGTVGYTKLINTTVVRQESVDFSTWKKGEYTIEIVGATGEKYSGTFTVE